MDKLISFILIAILLTGVYLGYNYYEKIHSNRGQEESFEYVRSVTVGWIGPLTGPKNFLGIDNLRAIQMALEEYQTSKGKDDPDIKLIVADEEFSVLQAINAYEKMVEVHKPTAIFITSYSDATALADRALKNSVLLIDPIDNDQSLSSINRNIFTIAKTTESLASIDADAISDQGKKNTVVIYFAGDDFMPKLAHTIEPILKSNGGEVKLFPYYQGKDDFLPFLEWGKARQADSYVFFGYEEIGSAMKLARQIGIKASFYSLNIITDPKIQADADGAADGTYFAHFTYLDGNPLKAENFINKYKNTHNQSPILEWTAMQAYDAAGILFESIKEAAKLPGNLTDNLRNELHKVSSYQGVSGNISILPSGASQGIYPSLYVLENGQAVPYSKFKEKEDFPEMRSVYEK